MSLLGAEDVVCRCSLDVGHSSFGLEEHKCNIVRIKNTICFMTVCVDSEGQSWCGAPTISCCVWGAKRYLEEKKITTKGGVTYVRD